MALKNKTHNLPDGTPSGGPSWMQPRIIADGKNPEMHP
jgi:hypothetical protein